MKKLLIVPVVALACSVSTGHASKVDAPTKEAYVRFLQEKIDLRKEILAKDKRLLEMKEEQEMLREKVHVSEVAYEKLMRDKKIVGHKLDRLMLEGDEWEFEHLSK